MHLKEINNKKIFYLIFLICIIGWLFSLKSTVVDQQVPEALSPFYFLPTIYWPILIIVIFLNLFISKSIFKIISILIIGLMTIGTFAIIVPFSGHGDAYYCVIIRHSLQCCVF